MIDVRHRYAHSADTVWQRIHDFGDLASWLPGVQACTVDGEGVGAVRTVQVMDGSEVLERLEAFDPQARSFSYAIIRAPGLDERAHFVATVSVHPDADGCEVRWQATFNSDGVPPEKVARARQRAEQMYGFCLQHLEGLLAH